MLLSILEVALSLKEVGDPWSTAYLQCLIMWYLIAIILPHTCGKTPLVLIQLLHRYNSTDLLLQTNNCAVNARGTPGNVYNPAVNALLLALLMTGLADYRPEAYCSWL